MDTTVVRKDNNGIIAAAFIAANKKKAEKNIKKLVAAAGNKPAEEGDSMGNKLLVDIKFLLGDVLKSPEQLEAEKKIANDNKKWAENAAEGLQKIRDNILFFEEEIVSSGGILNASQKAHLEKLREAEKQITSAGDEAIQEHRKFAEFLAEVRASTPSLKKAEEFVLRAVTENRYHKASDIKAKMITSLMKGKKPFPQGLIFLNGVNYLPTVEGVAKSKGQMALEAELTRFVRQSIKAYKYVKEAGASDDLRGLQAKRIGKYKIIFEKSERNGKKYDAGTGIIEVVIKKVQNGPVDQVLVIRPVEGFGSLKVFDTLAKRDFWVAASWYDADLSKKDNIPDALREDAEKFIRTLKAGVAAFYHRENGGGEKRSK